jgi:hypothetical protein
MDVTDLRQSAGENMSKWSAAHVTTGKWPSRVSVSGSSTVTVTVTNAANATNVHSTTTPIMTVIGTGSVGGTARHMLDGISAAFVIIPAESIYDDVEQSVGRAWKRDFEQIGRDFYRVIGAAYER